MGSQTPRLLHGLGLWLLYAVLGLLLVIVAVGGGDLGLDDEKRSPTRFRTKLVGAASGVLLGMGVLGSLLLRDPDAARDPSLLLAVSGWSLGGIVTLVAWVMIANDLRRRRS